MATIEELLRQETCIVEIRTENFTPLDLTNIPYEQHFQQDNEVKEAVRDIYNFIQLPWIIGTFENRHNERRDWRTKMGEKYGDAGRWLNHDNCLRGNKVQGLYSNLLFLDCLVLPSSPFKKPLQQLAIDATELWTNYKKLDTSEKVVIVENLKARIYKLLSVLMY